MSKIPLNPTMTFGAAFYLIGLRTAGVARIHVSDFIPPSLGTGEFDQTKPYSGLRRRRLDQFALGRAIYDTLVDQGMPGITYDASSGWFTMSRA